MVGLIVPLAIAITLAAVWRRSSLGLRDSALVTAILLGAFIASATELLSVFHAITKWPVVAVWTLAAGVALWCAAIPGRAWAWPKCTVTPLGLVPMLVVAFVLVVTFITICYAPPTNWDVILYHLPRQVQWLQQASVEHFCTQDYRLTVNPPFAEFCGLHAMVLTGSDRYNAAVSWLAMLMSLVAVSVLAKDLGATPGGQWFAACFAATVPMTIHESVSGKNDIMVALWLVTSVILLLRLFAGRASDGHGNLEFPSLARPANILFGITIGLLILTKGTGGVFAMPVVFAYAVGIVVQIAHAWRFRFSLRTPNSELRTDKKPDGPRQFAVCSDETQKTASYQFVVRSLQFVVQATLAGGIAAAMNAPHWHRNVTHYGSLAGQTFGLGNEIFTPAAVASNVIRNYAMYLSCPDKSINRKMNRLVIDIHSAIGIDAEDVRTTWGYSSFDIVYHPENEHAATCWHLLVFHLLSPMIVVIFLHKICAYQYAVVACIMAACGVMFCVVFKWQIWHSRLHVPIVMLASALVGRMITARPARSLSPLLAFALLASSWPALFKSEWPTSSIHPEIQRYLPVQSHGCAELVAGLVHGRVALINNDSSPSEYPLTRRLRSGYSPCTVGYFFPVKGSPTPFTADYVILLHPNPMVPSIGKEWLIQPGTGRTYHLKDSAFPFTLYEPAVAPENADFLRVIGRFGIGAEQVFDSPRPGGSP